MLVEFHYERLEGAVFNTVLESMLRTKLNTQLAIALSRITVRVPSAQSSVQEVSDRPVWDYTLTVYA